MSISRTRRRFLIGMAAAGATAGVMVPLSRYGLASMALQGKKEGAKLKVVYYVTPDGLGIDQFVIKEGEWNGKGIWHPSATSSDTADFQLNIASQELEPYKARALFLRGVASVDATDSPFGAHGAWNRILRDRAASQISIDNFVAKKLTGLNPSLGAIYAGPHTRVEAGGQPSFVSFDGATKRVPQKHPVVLFDGIFGTDLGGLEAVRSAHVFDPVKQDIDDVMSKVQGSERQKLQMHLDAVEQVAKDLEDVVEPGECTRERPELGGVDVDGPNDRNTVHAAHHKVVAAALACGTARVATIQVAYTLESLMINEVSTRKNPHDLAHWGLFDDPGGGAESDRLDWENSRRWYARKVKEFLDELAKHRDPDVPEDSLLEHTLVVFTSEMADGAPEHCMDLPLVLFGARDLLNYGSAGRYFDVANQGDVTWYPGRPSKQVSIQRIWATLARAVGAGEVPYAQNIDTVNGIFKNLP